LIIFTYRLGKKVGEITFLQDFPQIPKKKNLGGSSHASSFFPSDQQVYESWINDPTGEENYPEVHVSFNFVMDNKNTLPRL
jgi:hypothetical protein